MGERMGSINFKTSMSFTYGEPSPMGPGIVRLVANNPSPFTFKGTNTYIVGSTSLAVIDPGPDDAGHLADILRIAGSRPITHIFTTHAHRDHVDGVAALKAATGALVCGDVRQPLPDHLRALQDNPSGKAFIDYAFKPDLVMKPGQTLSCHDWALTAIHTPGHAPDHFCFALEGRNIVFSGDHVMAWNTTVVAPPEGRMADYIRSLEMLLDRNDTVFLPGHGGRLMEPQRTVKAYLLHRQWREKAVIAAIQGGAETMTKVVGKVYEGLAPQMRPAALLSVQAHLEYLIERGVVACDLPLHPDRVLAVL
jgi:glyoxylase-like metal-dependent hydrolase (beta-lactamase superfamily II)